MPNCQNLTVVTRNVTEVKLQFSATLNIPLKSPDTRHHGGQEVCRVGDAVVHDEDPPPPRPLQLGLLQGVVPPLPGNSGLVHAAFVLHFHLNLLPHNQCDALLSVIQLMYTTSLLFN